VRGTEMNNDYVSVTEIAGDEVTQEKGERKVLGVMSYI
jgi:hypothetical protein